MAIKGHLQTPSNSSFAESRRSNSVLGDDPSTYPAQQLGQHLFVVGSQPHPF